MENIRLDYLLNQSVSVKYPLLKCYIVTFNFFYNQTLIYTMSWYYHVPSHEYCELAKVTDQFRDFIYGFSKTFFISGDTHLKFDKDILQIVTHDTKIYFKMNHSIKQQFLHLLSTLKLL